jgi:dihydrolipoamide dehydrogenase
MTEETFDVVVIGAGPVGEVAAERAVRGGLSVALVESERFGGECSYWACIPSKALLRPGNLLAAARRMPGVPIGEKLDPAKVFQRRDYFTGKGDDSGQVDWAREAGIEPIRGRARITAEREITVESLDGGGKRVLRASNAVVVCTGSVPRRPDIPGLTPENVWGSREATSASEVPKRLGILGGGVVGVEMAQAWARLGSQVHLIIDGSRPLPRMPAFVGEAVIDGLRVDNVEVHLNSGLDTASPSEGALVLSLRDDRRVTVDKLLLATGRRPNVDDIGLDSIGFADKNALAVDDSGLVVGSDGEWLYAAGDVTGRAPVTHQGKYEARVVGDAISARARGDKLERNLWGAHAMTADHYAVPQVVFTDPEVASVGLTQPEEGKPQQAVDLDIAVAGSSLYADGYQGKMRAIVDTEREVLLGVTFVGQDVAELLHAATIAIVGEVPLSRLWHAVPAFPTISEVWLRLLEHYGM